MPDPALSTSPWGSRADRAAERDAKRKAVLTTAVRFFNSKGFAATSLDDVAKALQVTKPTIYHYFSSKDEILFECVRLGLEAIRDAAEQVRARGGSGRERLEALMLEYALVMTRDFGICVTRTSDDQLGDDSRVRFRALKREIDLILRDVITDGMEDGTLAQGDPRVVCFTISGALNWIARWYRPNGPMTAQDVARSTVATLMAGLAS
ncbi:TetR/AcrR family transcriptional regulator [Chachezhania antarctica]|uniref:TetR/AcrR family transcriptional regulator n=1 Tax=Chachezhania antarctica TaxID=2340860 RepID=UPI000EB4833B|nr:TetR/AcrR family transcriptional regulator [Chachezhania antarctica]|tara:strand:- start:1560 stop:2183 length:624 start_codon:yes stop_codon:yes gene_type:complete